MNNLKFWENTELMLRLCWVMVAILYVAIIWWAIK